MPGVRRSKRPQVLKATIPDIRSFATLLRGVCFSTSSQRATMTINQSGIMVIVEEARTLLSAAIISKEIFDTFEYNPDPEFSTTVPIDDNTDGESNSPSHELHNTALEFPLHVLLECLNIFGTALGGSSGHGNSSVLAQRQPMRRAGESSESGSDGEEKGKEEQSRTNGGVGQKKIDAFFARTDGKGTGMRLSYAGAGFPLVLLLAEDANGPTTTCEIVTYDAEPHLELPIDNSNIVLRCILKSSWLRDALSEIDPSCDKMTFVANPTIYDTSSYRPASKPLLRIMAVGTFGSTEMDYPNDKEVLETFDCDTTASFSYRFSHITRTIKALQSSLKTSLRIDAEGVLSLQFLSYSTSPRGGTAVSSIIDFKCLSIDED